MTGNSLCVACGRLATPLRHGGLAQGSSGRCIAALRQWPAPTGLAPWGGRWKRRFEHAVKLLKSSGMNGVALNNVNSCGANTRILESEILANVSANVGPILQRWGLTPYISACYAAPFIMANVSSDPANPQALAWWKRKVSEIKQLLPTFGGFVVKADSEGNQGPQAFNRTEADGANLHYYFLRSTLAEIYLRRACSGQSIESRNTAAGANLLARALRPEGGIVMWRAFVYGGRIDGRWQERAKQAYLTFKPLDGLFDDNVIVQIKNGARLLALPLSCLSRSLTSAMLASSGCGCRADGFPGPRAAVTASRGRAPAHARDDGGAGSARIHGAGR